MPEGRPSVAARWRRYARLHRGAPGAIATSVALSLVQSALVLPIAVLVRRVFDVVIPAHDTTALLLAAGALLGLYAAGVGITLLTRHLVLATVKRGIAELRSTLLDRLYTHALPGPGRVDLGRVHATVVHDTERVDNMGNALVGQLLPALAVSVALAVWLALIDGRLLLAAAAVAPPILFVNRVLGARVRRQVALARADFEDFSRGTLVALTALQLTRAQSAERQERSRLARIVGRVEDSGHRVAWLSAAYTLVQNALTATGAIVILVVGGLAVGSGAMTHGELASFYVGVMLLAGQLSIILASVPHVIAGDASLAAVVALLDSLEPPVYQGTARGPFAGAVALEHVDFDYGERRILQGLRLACAPGTITAVVGPNGSGKTTILNLVLGFLRPRQGRVLADARPYDELDVGHLRRSIGVVPQDPMLLPGTIWENLTYGLDEVSRADVDRACELAAADTLVASLPLGYETVVGDGGSALSGGERQRLALARAIVRRPALLVLDEPSTHLDASAAATLLASLPRLPQRPAVLIATHDVALCAIADAVYRLSEGRATVDMRPRSEGRAAG